MHVSERKLQELPRTLAAWSDTDCGMREYSKKYVRRTNREPLSVKYSRVVEQLWSCEQTRIRKLLTVFLVKGLSKHHTSS